VESTLDAEELHTIPNAHSENRSSQWRKHRQIYPRASELIWTNQDLAFSVLAAVNPVRHPSVETCHAARHVVGIAHNRPLDLRYQKRAHRMAFSQGKGGQSFETRMVSSSDDDWGQFSGHVMSPSDDGLRVLRSSSRDDAARCNRM
jgi:hypothetical protein